MIQFHEHIFRMGRNHQLLKIFNHTKRRLFFLCSLGNSGKNESISLGVENSGNAAMNSEIVQEATIIEQISGNQEPFQGILLEIIS